MVRNICIVRIWFLFCLGRISMMYSWGRVGRLSLVKGSIDDLFGDWGWM